MKSIYVRRTAALLAVLTLGFLLSCADDTTSEMAGGDTLSLTSWSHILVDSTRTRIPGKTGGGSFSHSPPPPPSLAICSMTLGCC